MGYEVHITRAADWSESEDAPINLEEWLAYVASDPEMRHDGFAEARSSRGDVLRIQNEGLAVWTAWPGEGRGNGRAWMDYHRGRIVVKDPDAALLRKMCAIAEKLGARVQGDEGELYPESAEDGEGAEAALEAARPRAPWWKRLIFGR